MQLVERLELSIDEGVIGDYEQCAGDRQVTLLAAEAWQAAADDVGADLPWHTRRANVLIEGLVFDRDSGFEVRIGDCRVAVRGETMPCRLMEEACAGLLKAMTPDRRGGVHCQIVEGGVIAIGDAVEIC